VSGLSMRRWRTLRMGFAVTSIYESARGLKDEQVIEMALKYD